MRPVAARTGNDARRYWISASTGRATRSLDGMPKVSAIAKAKKHLRGVWRSDHAKTMATWKFPKGLASSKKQRLSEIFGKNTWEFRARTCITTFEDLRSIERYRVLWADEESAIVLFHGHGDESCHQLHFRDSHFFVVAGHSGNVEFFKRMPSNNVLERTGKRRGRPARAINGVRGPGRNRQRRPAAQLNR